MPVRLREAALMRLETGSEALGRALQGRLPPAACLVTGPGGEALARTMAAALVCTASDPILSEP